MTPSENLASMEAWTSRLPFANSWISEAFSPDNETLTKALQRSLSAASQPDTLPLPLTFSSGGGGALFDLFNKQPINTQMLTTSGISGCSDPETAPKRRAVTATAKIAKRKSRASKRTHTTFIIADPANFRQMVQQVTGVRVDSAQLPVPPLLKPEPQRPGNRLHACLPTLDTSAFLLDHHHHQQQLVGPAAIAVASPQQVPSSLSFLPAVASDGGAALDYDGFAGFPTLESWEVM